MKVGDLIKFMGSFDKDRIGMLISMRAAADGFDGWWEVLDCDGKMVIWPASQIEVIHEG